MAPGIDHIRTGLSEYNHLPFQQTGLAHATWHQSGSQALQTLLAPVWHSAHDLRSHGTEYFKLLSSAANCLLHRIFVAPAMLVPSPYSPEVAYIIEPPAEKNQKIWISPHQLRPFLSGQGLRMEPATKQPVEQTQVCEKATWTDQVLLDQALAAILFPQLSLMAGRRLH